MRIRKTLAIILLLCGSLYANYQDSAQTFDDNVVRIRDIVFVGNDITQVDALMKLIPFNAGDVLDTAMFQLARANLRAAQAFDQIDIFAQHEEDGADVYIVLKESMRIDLKYGLLYYTHLHGVENLWFRYHFDVSILNFRGRFETVSAGVDFWEQKGLRLGWLKPFKPTPYYMSLNTEIKTYPSNIMPVDYTDVIAGVTFGRRVSGTSRVYVGAMPTYRHGEIVTLDNSVHDTLRDEIYSRVPHDFQKNQVELFALTGFVNDHRNARFMPRSGWLYGAHFSTNSPYSDIADAVPFYQMSNEFRYYVPALKFDALALRARHTLRNTRAGEYHRLTYGNHGEVRGYSADELGWNFITNSSILASAKYYKRIYNSPQIPMEFIRHIFNGVSSFSITFDATAIADYARLYDDPFGALLLRGEQEEGIGIGGGVRISIPEVRQSGCIDVVYGRVQNKNGTHSWEPMLHIYLDMFF